MYWRGSSLCLRHQIVGREFESQIVQRTFTTSRLHVLLQVCLTCVSEQAEFNTLLILYENQYYSII